MKQTKVPANYIVPFDRPSIKLNPFAVAAAQLIICNDVTPEQLRAAYDAVNEANQQAAN